jgi:transposase-like protein
MIPLTCQRCQSNKLRKNGHTKDGHQKFHCQNCNFYSTLQTQHDKRAEQHAMIEKLSAERNSIRSIARATGLNKDTVMRIQHNQKKRETSS